MDPLVREDGEPEPEVHLSGAAEPGPGAAPAAEDAVIPTENPDPAAEDPALPVDSVPAGVHPVRARLLAKAAARAARERPPAGLEELEPEPVPPGSSLDMELDLVAAPSSRAPSAPVVG